MKSTQEQPSRTSLLMSELMDGCGWRGVSHASARISRKPGLLVPVSGVATKTNKQWS